MLSLFRMADYFRDILKMEADSFSEILEAFKSKSSG